MILKAGTYRFNDELEPYSIINDDNIDSIADFQFYLPISTITLDDGSHTENYGFIRIPCLKYSVTELGLDNNNLLFATNSTDETDILAYADGLWLHDGVFQTHTIEKDIDVPDTYGSWYVSNTNYNEVNAEDTIYTEKSSWYKSVADAIRNKKGTTDPILRDDFASEISSITGGEEVPYYDGTVIIEKAESVLGLRRFKENLTPIEHNSAVTDQWGYFDVYVDLHFDIEPVTIDELGITVYGMTPLVNFTDNNSSTDYPKMVISATASDGSTERTLMSVDFSNGNAVAGLVVNVLSTANTTVDEWLLANTEGVSV